MRLWCFFLQNDASPAVQKNLRTETEEMLQDLGIPKGSPVAILLFIKYIHWLAIYKLIVLVVQRLGLLPFDQKEYFSEQKIK